MTRRIRVRGIPRPEPDVRLYVLALIELARQLQEDEAANKKHGPGTRPHRSAAEDLPDD